ncbi:MAG: MGMT family protein [Cyclobacteriaceae bacterium]|nr:MGMT family protein [Cyclobacteriaceae bacterium SS2]
MKDNPNFFNDVYEVVRLVPHGKVTSYGAIANYLGVRRSARMVGWAMNGAPQDVPAHRVLNRNGLLTGKNAFSTPTLMQELLEKEGIQVKNDQVVNLKQHFWDPTTEIGL